MNAIIHLRNHINEQNWQNLVVRTDWTFICELIPERYIYLRNTRKQQKITNYVWNKSFLKFYLVYNDACLKLLGSLL